MANLATIAIEKLNETGVVVMSLTCDNPSNNWTMLKEMGAKLTCDGLKTALDIVNILGYPIYATPDVCHLIKLVRNTLGDFQIVKNSENDNISWVYFKSLNTLQESEGLHIANRLRKKHIQWQKNKMNVKLATQTFSRSVADAIDYCRDVLKLKEFEGSEATTEFIRIFDKLFDILNSKSKFGKYSKAALSSSTIESTKAFFVKAKQYIIGLSLSNGKNLVDSQRKRAFLGFIAVMDSFENMFDLYVKNDHLEYLLTFKFREVVN